MPDPPQINPQRNSPEQPPPKQGTPAPQLPAQAPQAPLEGPQPVAAPPLRPAPSLPPQVPEIPQQPVQQSVPEPALPLPLQAPAGTPVPPSLAQPAAQQVVKEKLTLHALLNRIRLNNVLLTNIGLGDVLFRLASAISRSGVRYDENGNPTVKGVNKGVGAILKSALGKTTRSVEVVPDTIGYDPPRPMFVQGEAHSIPISAEAVMLLPLDELPPVYPDTDSDGEASEVK